MCIRDSSRIVQLWSEWCLYDVLQEAINREPVSYTHLDVYKRQSIPFNEPSRGIAGKSVY